MRNCDIRSKVAGRYTVRNCACFNELRSYPATSDFGIESCLASLLSPDFLNGDLIPKGIEVLFLDHFNWLSAIIGITFMNILKASHFLSCCRNLRALRT